MDYHIINSLDCCHSLPKTGVGVFSCGNGAGFSKRIGSQAETPYVQAQLKHKDLIPEVL